jgi:hydrogenase expression/formation protein HypE
VDDDRITLAHGNGGRFMRELIEDVFAAALSASELDVQADAVPIELGDGEVMITTDGFTVQPLEFPGGDIGSLAIHGTTNDLAVAGARPMFLTLNAFIEEGFEVARLERIVRSLADAALEAGVRISAGDTKVVRRGEGGGIYLATTGVGVRLPGVQPSLDKIRDGDVISDAGPVMSLTEPLLAFDGLRFMRDPTRGGIASIGHEILKATGLGVRFEATVPVREAVQSVCDMLGYDPYYLACEGRVVAIVAPDDADAALATWRGLPAGGEAARIGRITRDESRVILETPLGGERFLEELEDDPLPRIC